MLPMAKSPPIVLQKTNKIFLVIQKFSFSFNFLVIFLRGGGKSRRPFKEKEKATIVRSSRIP